MIVLVAMRLGVVPLVNAFVPSSVSSNPLSLSSSVSRLKQQELKEEECLQRRTSVHNKHTSLLALQRGQSSSGNSNRPYRVGIAGAGAVALGTAALLAKAGHDPMVWSPSGNSTFAFDRSSNGNGSDAPQLISTGALERTCPLRFARSARELVYTNDVLLLALPANGHKAVMDELAAQISNANSGQQHVIISSHASMGALYLKKLLHERGIVDTPVTAWGTTVVTARREQNDDAGAEVRINTIRTSVDGCTVPSGQTQAGLELCSALFPGIEFRPRDGLLAISLSNLNPQNHLGMALCNFSRMEKGEAWHQSLNVTPKVGKYLEALDAERLAIASALGFNVRTIFEHFHLSFHVELRDNISDMCQDIYREGRDVLGPATTDSRYVMEDAPFGLALTVILGNLVQRPAVLHQAGLAILSSMYERDFFANDLLKALHLENVTLDQLKRAAHTGRLEDERTLARERMSILSRKQIS